ncbi:hypothetical protein HYFRA_00002094 [Hymenoscyphus fraxineus]|uniref:Zn(2)-C6 fungal-type domain-containing protein n=1 Tax=Hymenoscyphus fraxineus TaxID=746836 RepID=A0A9N9PJR9_9HELO|nr:hypothetical protein HYFRA_00002094 [Hymenoscyphus fraxineus]
MRLTLRRSCDACAKAKHRCDLQTPCSRCIKRNIHCVFQNEPLTAISTVPMSKSSLTQTARVSKAIDDQATFPRVNTENRLIVGAPFPSAFGAGFLDPFDSYPQTSLPRIRVQGLIHHFLSKIAFQYYPLDLNPGSNPFIASWWPLALTDPALFNVSLQTASLDDELREQRGFPHSETLMADSVVLVRKKIQDPSLAFQDATMDAVVTMAAIEFGKGKFEVSKMHISGVIRMVEVRGGLQEVKKSSPLTARMVPWVAMLVYGTPQFPTQNDFGFGDGVSTTQIWKEASSTDLDTNGLVLGSLDLEPSIQDIFSRLRNVFSHFSNINPHKFSEMSSTDLHDLTCFILHRLLPIIETPNTPSPALTISNCLRCAISIYFLIIHGPTYYSHTSLLTFLVLRLQKHLELLPELVNADDSLKLWLVSLGMTASKGITDDYWFAEQASILATSSNIRSWEDVVVRLRDVLWLDTQRCRPIFQTWEEVLNNVL